MGSIRGGGAFTSFHLERLTSSRRPALKALPDGLLSLSDSCELFKQTAQRMRPVGFHQHQHPLPATHRRLHGGDRPLAAAAVSPL